MYELVFNEKNVMKEKSEGNQMKPNEFKSLQSHKIKEKLSSILKQFKGLFADAMLPTILFCSQRSSKEKRFSLYLFSCSVCL